MTIKPAAKRAPPDADGNLENPNGAGVTGDPNNHGQHGQSPQRRELYEDLSRHRCSPNKSRSKRRDHLLEHHKRERNDWSKHNENVGNAAAASPRSMGVGNMLLSNAAAAAVGLTLTPAAMNVSGGGVVVGRNSPAMNDVTSAAAAAAAAAVATGGAGGGNANVVGNSVGVGGGGGGVGGVNVNVGGVVGVNAATATVSNPTTATAAAGMLQGAITQNVLKAIEESCSGYNSGDEHMPTKEKTVPVAEWKRRDEQFVRVMSEAGFEVRQVEEDGACLFRAISLQIYGSEDEHDIVRQHTMDYIYKNREYFSQFVTEDINSYITRKRRKDSHGNHIEIQAMSEIYARPVEVYCYKSKPINIFNSEQQGNGYAPLRLSYQRMSHYNAIIDPYNATVGVGLGLANFHPTMQTKDAMLMSEQLQIEQTMFEDKLKTTDWEATNEVIEEQVARESYLQWCRENLQKNRAAAVRSATSTVTSAQAHSSSEMSATTMPLDDIAMPSKQAALGENLDKAENANNVAKGCNENENLGCVNVAKSSSNMLVTRQFNQMNFFIENNEHVGGGGGGGGGGGTGGHSPSSTKKSNVKAKMQKDATATTELGYDTDDTDISTNSSLADGGGGGGGGESPKTALLRAKKIKTRYGSKKRRHEQLMRQSGECGGGGGGGGADISIDNASGNGSGSNSSGSGNDTTPRVHKGAKRDNVGIEKKSTNNETKLEERPCSSKCAQLPTAAAAEVAAANASAVDITASDTTVSNEQKMSDDAAATTTTTTTTTAPLSTFYQDLLESSYDNSGYGQLTEAEMLQRAIQLSTQDYIEHQKRKYLFRP